MIIEDCTLEIDNNSGAIYVRDPKASVLLTITGLPYPIPKPTKKVPLDIALTPGLRAASSWPHVKVKRT